MRGKLLVNILAGGFLLLWMCACQTVQFYSQAVQGHLEVLSKAKPIQEVKGNSSTLPALRERLGLVEEMRAFAGSKLQLPMDRQFRTYADLGRPYVVWVVLAAPEFSLEAKGWNYPFLGKLTYRGYYAEAPAKRLGKELEEQGWDVVVAGVRVYSTLGYFSDPILNTFVGETEEKLAETLFHELTHARFFARGDTDFNEAYATAVGQEGVRQWLRDKGEGRAIRAYDRKLAQEARVLNLLRESRAELAKLYAQRGTISDDRMREGKRRILDDARARYRRMVSQGQVADAYNVWFGPTLNNARLASIATYYDLVPEFVSLYHEQGRNWEAFHQAVAEMKSLSKEERRRRLAEMPRSAE